MTVPDYDAVSSTLGATTVRAAEALLRSLGDGGIVLRLPLPAVVPNSDLGLAGPLTEDVTLGPALLQVIQPDAAGSSCHMVRRTMCAVDRFVDPGFGHGFAWLVEHQWADLKSRTQGRPSTHCVHNQPSVFRGVARSAGRSAATDALRTAELRS